MNNITKYLHQLIFSTLVVVVTLSCQGKSSNTVHRVLKEPNFFEFANEQKVVCHEQDSCSPSVGNLIGYTSKKNNDGVSYTVSFGNCTGSLITEDLVITNRHCFLDQHAKAGDKCPAVFIKFPKVHEYPEELAQCEQIVFRPELYPKTEKEMIQNLDVAIIKLTKPVKRPTLKVSTEGFKNNEWITIHRVTTQESGSYLEALHCPVIQDAAITEVARLASNPSSAFVYLGDCAVIESNSGSPIVDSQGQIKGVLSMFIDSQKVKQPFPIAAKAYKDGAGGINLACVNYPVINQQKSIPAECASTLDWMQQTNISNQRLNQLKADRMAMLSSKANEFYLKIAKQFPLNYEQAKDGSANFLDFLSAKGRYWFYPSCVESAQQLSDAYASLTILPIFIEESKFDEVGRLSEKIDIESFHITSINILESKSEIDLEIKGELKNKPETFRQKIDLCGK